MHLSICMSVTEIPDSSVKVRVKASLSKGKELGFKARLSYL